MRATRTSELDLSTGRPGPRDFTVRIEIVRPLANARCNPIRPSHPTPNARDDSRTPLFDEHGTGGNVEVICPTAQGEMLRQSGTTGNSGMRGMH